MRFQISELVITPENESTAKRIIEITQPRDKPEMLYLTGPAECGKSTFMETRGTEKDLLSTKSAMYCHASEILAMLSIDNENADNFLNKVGDVAVLFIDDVDDFLKNDAVGSKVCQLLIDNRVKQGLDTVASSRNSFSELDSRLQSVFASFEEIVMPELSVDGAVALSKSYANHFARVKGAENVNVLSEEVFSYLGKKYHHSLKEMAPAMEYLVTVAELPNAKIETPEQVDICLG